MPNKLEAFKAQHARAFRKLAEYAADDEISAERINPILNAKTLEELAALADEIQFYCVCTISIDYMHHCLTVPSYTT